MVPYTTRCLPIRISTSPHPRSLPKIMNISIFRCLLVACFCLIAVTTLKPATVLANTGSSYMQQVMDSWIGEQYNDLSRNWGVPTTWFYTKDGRKMFIFTANQFQIKTHHISCIRKVVVNYDETITQGFWEGNCDPNTTYLGDTSSWPNWKRFSYNNTYQPFENAITSTHH